MEDPTQREGAGRGGRRALLFVLMLAVAAVLLFLVTRDDDGETSELGGNDEESSQTTEETRSDEPTEEGPEESSETTDESGPAAASVLELDSSGDEATDVFEVALNWELRWQAPEAGSFSVELFNEAGESRGVLIGDSEDRQGSTFVSEAGSFYLEVSSDGDWSISVIGLPAE